MGLVALTPIDTLFNPPGLGAGKRGDAQGLPGKFTDLLAALLGGAAGDQSDAGADGVDSHASATGQAASDGKAAVDALLALLAAGRGKAGDEGEGMPAMAALLAALLHPGATPVDTSTAVKDADQASAMDPSAAAVPTVAAPTVDTAGATTLAAQTVTADVPTQPVGTAPAAVSQPLPASTDVATPPVNGDAAPPNPLATDGSAPMAATTPPAPDAAAASAPAVQALTTTEASTTAATTTAVAVTGEVPALPATGQVAAPAHDDDPRNLKADGGPDPAGPPLTATVQEGVVRFVGNAQKGKHEGQEDGPDLSDHEPGVPRASAQGIAHASDNSAVAQLRTPVPDAAPVDPVTAPPPPAAPSPAVEQVAHAIIGKAAEGGGEAHLRLDPPNLGEVTIHVRITGDHVRVDVRAERPETMQMLRDQSLDLTSLLHGRGLDLTDVNVGLGGRQAPDTSANGGSDGRGQRSQNGEFASLLGLDDEAVAPDRFNRLQAAYNPDGAHVYRI